VRWVRPVFVAPVVRMTRLFRILLVWCCWFGLSFAEVGSLPSVYGDAAPGSIWVRLLSEAEQLDLPTKFLKTIPAEFIRFEFDDLRTYAAEYHPGEHRMVLNRSLSFNAAGRMLKPLTKMTHKELEVLYHELFHAYMDYLASLGEQAAGVSGASNELMDFARTQQVCRYGEVMIAPLAQRPDNMESRYLTESESWEALNETWAVFIGWSIWSQLEVQRNGAGMMVRQQRQMEQWVRRLETAFLNGEFRGYYVPQDIDERRIAQKRFLARPSQLTWREAEVLMGQVLGFPGDLVNRAKRSPGLSVIIGAPSPC
jgi:hypothetical protein